MQCFYSYIYLFLIKFRSKNLFLYINDRIYILNLEGGISNCYETGNNNKYNIRSPFKN